MKTKLTLLALLLALAACQPAEGPDPFAYVCTVPAPDSVGAHPQVLELQQLLETAVAEGTPGVVAYVRTPDQRSWLGAAGMASLGQQAPMEPCHRMLVASVSKVFVATAIFQLIEQGALSLNDPLGDHLQGEYMNRIRNAKVVTIRQLLNHTSGLYDYLDPIRFELWSLQKPFETASVLDRLALAYDRAPTHEPGATYYYSNTNFVLLGLLVEELSGLTLEDYMDAHLFAPLGLTSAVMGTVENPIPTGVPEGYLALQDRELLQPSRFFYGNDLATGDGGIAIRMDDLGIFLAEVFAGDLLTPATRTAMQQAFELPDDWQGGYHTYNAQGIEIFDTPYGRALGHTGAIGGFLTTAWYFIETGAIITHSVNGVSPRIEEARWQLTNDLLEAVFAE